MADEKEGCGCLALICVAAIIGVAVFFPSCMPVGIGIWQTPLKIETRSSMVGNGGVVRVSNPSDSDLSDVKIVCYNPGTQKTKTYNMGKWSQNKSEEIGWMEGWAWEDGEEITVKASGYRSKTIKISGVGRAVSAQRENIAKAVVAGAAVAVIANSQNRSTNKPTQYYNYNSYVDGVRNNPITKEDIQRQTSPAGSYGSQQSYSAPVNTTYSGGSTGTNVTTYSQPVSSTYSGNSKVNTISNSYYSDSMGRNVGSSTKFGNTTYYNDSNMKPVGSSTKFGNTTYYNDSNMKPIGSSYKSRNTTYYQNFNGQTVGSSKTSGNTTYYQDFNGRRVGSSKTLGNTTYFYNTSGQLIGAKNNY